MNMQIDEGRRDVSSDAASSSRAGSEVSARDMEHKAPPTYKVAGVKITGVSDEKVREVYALLSKSAAQAYTEEEVKAKMAKPFSTMKGESGNNILVIPTYASSKDKPYLLLITVLAKNLGYGLVETTLERAVYTAPNEKPAALRERVRVVLDILDKVSAGKTLNLTELVGKSKQLSRFVTRICRSPLNKWCEEKTYDPALYKGKVQSLADAISTKWIANGTNVYMCQNTLNVLWSKVLGKYKFTFDDSWLKKQETIRASFFSSPREWQNKGLFAPEEIDYIESVMAPRRKTIIDALVEDWRIDNITACRVAWRSLRATEEKELHDTIVARTRLLFPPDPNGQRKKRKGKTLSLEQKVERMDEETIFNRMAPFYILHLDKTLGPKMGDLLKTTETGVAVVDAIEGSQRTALNVWVKWINDASEEEN